MNSALPDKMRVRVDVCDCCRQSAQNRGIVDRVAGLEDFGEHDGGVATD